MAGVNTLSARAYTLKYVYLDKIRENMNLASPLLNRIQKKTKPYSKPDGKSWVIDIDYAPHGGVGARADNGALPTAGYRGDINATYDAKYVYGVTDFTGPTINALESSESTFDGTGTARSMKTLSADMKKEMNRMMFGSGYGYLSTVTSASSEVITFKGRNSTNYQLGWGCTFGNRYLWVGGRTDIVDFAAGTSMTLETANEAGGTLTAVTSTTATQTTDPGYTEAAGDWFCRYGAINAATVTAPKTLEPYGLWAICNDVDADDCISYNGTSGTTTGEEVGGLAIGTYDWWKGGVVYNNGTSAKFAAPTDLDLSSMDEAFYESVRKHGPEKAPTAIYCTWQAWQKYGDILRADRRYDGAVMDLDGGFTGLSYRGVPVIPDTDAADGIMFFVHEPSLILFQPGPMDWLDRDGSILKWVSGYDAYIAILYWYLQLGTDCRSAHTILYNVDEF